MTLAVSFGELDDFFMGYYGFQIMGEGNLPAMDDFGDRDIHPGMKVVTITVKDLSEALGIPQLVLKRELYKKFSSKPKLDPNSRMSGGGSKNIQDRAKDLADGGEKLKDAIKEIVQEYHQLMKKEPKKIKMHVLGEAGTRRRGGRRQVNDSTSVWNVWEDNGDSTATFIKYDTIRDR